VVFSGQVYSSIVVSWSVEYIILFYLGSIWYYIDSNSIRAGRRIPIMLNYETGAERGAVQCALR